MSYARQKGFHIANEIKNPASVTSLSNSFFYFHVAKHHMEMSTFDHTNEQ